MRQGLLGFLQVVGVAVVGVLAYGLTFLVAPSAPWAYRIVVGLAAAAATYWWAVHSRPKPWVTEAEESAMMRRAPRTAPRAGRRPIAPPLPQPVAAEER